MALMSWMLVGLSSTRKSRHAGAVQLEEADGFAAREHLERFFVVERNVLDVHVNTLDIL